MPEVAAAPRGRTWAVQFARALVAVIPGGIISFTANHSPALGLLMFGGFAIATAIVLVIGVLITPDRIVRIVFVVQAIVGFLAGVLALSLSGAGLALMLYLVSVWALITGFLELYLALRSRGRRAEWRDWLVAGGFTVILGIVFLVIPDQALLADGLFGAYGIIVGVYLGINAFTTKWGLTSNAEDE